MNYLEKYRSLKNFMALCQSPYGNGIMKEYPWLIKDFEKIQSFIENTLIENKESSDVEILEDKKTLNEFLGLLNLIPLTNLETIVTINKQITDLKLKLSNKLAYDSESYYDIYFLQLGVTQKDNANYANLNLLNKDSMSFKNWFANSKVVDKNGSPLVVFHGSPNVDFSRFKFDIFPGIYFAENEKYSEYFSRRGKDGTMYQCYLRVQNPLDLTLFKTDKVKYNDFVYYIKLKYNYDLPENKMLKTQSEKQNGLWAWWYLRTGVDWLRLIIKDKKFDGISFYENNPDEKDAQGNDLVTPAWMVFEPNQIKSAHSNVLFSIDSKDIRYKLGGEL
jgi:ADP-Ribosyltransferase in polyvalent proteins